MSDKQSSNELREPEIALSDIALLRAVSTKGGIRAAAGSGQPAAEKKIGSALKRLEDVLRCKLRVPNSRPLELTTEGLELVTIGRQVFDQLNAFVIRCRKLPPTITLGGGDSLVHWVLLPAIPTIQDAASSHGLLINFSIISGTTLKLSAALRDSEIHFALLSHTARLEKKWRKSEVGEHNYCVICPRVYLEGGKFAISRTPFSIIRDHWGVNIANLAFQAGVDRSRCVLVETFTHVANLVATQRYAGILPVFTASYFSSENFRSFTPRFLIGQTQKVNLVWNHEAQQKGSEMDRVREILIARIREELRLKRKNPLE